jgi:hypothetical protein
MALVREDSPLRECSEFWPRKNPMTVFTPLKTPLRTAARKKIDRDWRGELASTG